MKERLFFDSDVILDISTGRKPFSEPAAGLLSMAEWGKCDGYTSALVISNVYYVLRKLAGNGAALSFLKKLRLILKILPVDDLIIQKALESHFPDFEDAIQYYTSVQSGITCIITRNGEDYKKSVIPVCTPQEFLFMKKDSL